MKKLLTLILIIVFSASAFAQKKTKNIIIITFDGMRWKDVFRGADSSLFYSKQFTSQNRKQLNEKYWAVTAKERREKLMPFIWSTIARNGQIYGNRDAGNFVNVKNPYWFSYPGYNEMFSGYPDTLVNSNNYPPNPNITVQEFINQQPGFQGKVAAFTSWSAFNRILNKERCGFVVNAGYEDYTADKSPLQAMLNEQQHLLPQIFGPDERPDAVTFSRVKDYIKTKHPRVLQFSMIDTDAWGHQGKYDFYLDAAHNSDAMIADIWSTIQADPFYKDHTTLYLAVDHGRGDNEKWTSHGAKVEHSNEIWCAAMGPDTQPSGEVMAAGQLYQYQHAKTIAALLGLNFTSAKPIGPVISGYLNGK